MGEGHTPGPELLDALAEIFILREALKGAIVGDKIIRDQFASADEPILRWAHGQAAKNLTCNQRSLERSLADFPWGIAGRPLAALSKVSGGSQ